MVTETMQTLEMLVSKERLKDINHWISKYPAEERQSAVMSTLRILQEEMGYLTPASMDAVAVYLKMPKIAVYEVASFYSMYEHSPCGKHLVNVCTNISCMLQGAEETVTQLEKKLKVKLGGTTADGQFTLRKVECLGACVHAPVVQVDKDYHENVTNDKIDDILKQYREQEK